MRRGIEVDGTKDAGVSPQCGTAFVTQKAMNNCSLHVNTSGNTINIFKTAQRTHRFSEQELEKKRNAIAEHEETVKKMVAKTHKIEPFFPLFYFWFYRYRIGCSFLGCQFVFPVPNAYRQVLFPLPVLLHLLLGVKQISRQMN